MAFFAILDETSTPTFEVNECHINLWLLNGWFGRTIFFLDVGLLLKATDENDLSRLEIIVPAGTEPTVQSLHQHVLDPSVGTVLFGVVTTVSGATVSYRKEGEDVEWQVGVIDSSKSKLDTENSGKGFSYWKLRLKTPIPKQSEQYVRFRFRLTTLGRMWIWERVRFLWFAKNGAIADVRIADLRDAAHLTELQGLQDRLVSIKKLRLFIVVPSWLRAQTHDPQRHYIRLHEGRAWEGYLGRRVNLLKSQKLIIYEWRSKGVEIIDPERPFRAFAQFARQPGFLPWYNHFATAALVLVPIFLFSKWTDVSNTATSFFAAAQHWILGVGIIGAISFVASKFAPGRKLASWIGRLLRFGEDASYSLFSGRR